MTVAFVFSGGASLGAVQAGMAQALAEQGIVPDIVLGTSVGAMNAAFIDRLFAVGRTDRGGS